MPVDFAPNRCNWPCNAKEDQKEMNKDLKASQCSHHDVSVQLPYVWQLHGRVTVQTEWWYINSNHLLSSENMASMTACETESDTFWHSNKKYTKLLFKLL